MRRYLLAGSAILLCSPAMAATPLYVCAHAGCARDAAAAIAAEAAAATAAANAQATATSAAGSIATIAATVLGYSGTITSLSNSYTTLLNEVTGLSGSITALYASVASSSGSLSTLSAGLASETTRAEGAEAANAAAASSSSTTAALALSTAASASGSAAAASAAAASATASVTTLGSIVLGHTTSIGTLNTSVSMLSAGLASETTRAEGAETAAAATANAAVIPSGANTAPSQFRSNVLNVTQRGPLASDVAGYTPGSSLWLYPVDNFWELSRVNNGIAEWIPYPFPGTFPGSTVPGFTFAGGTACSVSGWTHAVLTLTRAIDGLSKDIGCVGPHQLDTASALAWTATSGGIGYVTALHDQSDGGVFDGTLTTSLDWTQTTLKNAPRLAFEFGSSGNIPIAFDYIYRNYLYSQLGTWPVSNTGSSTLVCFTGQTSMGIGQPGLWFIQPGMTLSSANFSGGVDTILSFNYTSNCATMAVASTLAVTGVAVNDAPNSAIFLNAPSGFPTNNQAHTVLVAGRHGSNNQLAKTLTYLGAPETFPSSPSSYVQLVIPGSTGSGTSLKVVAGSAGVSNPTNIGNQWPSSSDQVIGYSLSNSIGTCTMGSGRCVSYQMDGIQGIATNAQGMAAATLTGGGFGYSAQNTSTGLKNNDQFLYDLFIAGATAMTPAQMTQITAAEDAMRGWYPQVVQGQIEIGSSTTQGNGTSQPAARPALDGFRAGGVQPLRVWNQGSGGGPAVDIYNFAALTLPLLTPYRNRLVTFLGEGNGDQQGGTFPIISQAGSMMTTSTTLTTGNPSTPIIAVGTSLAPLVQLSGTPAGCLAVGTAVLNIASPTSFSVSPPPLSTCTSVSVLGETGANEIVESQYLDNLLSTEAVSIGFSINYIKVGSASRGTFTSPQLVEFGTYKAILYSNCQPDVNGYSTGCSMLPYLKGYIDLEMDPFFGGDNAVMTVSTVVDSTHVTVNTLSNYAAVGNRIEWYGMPYSISADTGNETITAVSGNTLTVSGSTQGMYSGELIRAINPAPWTTYPWPTGCMNLDKQHFTPFCYSIQSAKDIRLELSVGMLN